MKTIDYVLLGLENIWRRKTRSFLTILAVVIGAISITIMISLVLGAERVATQQLESIGGLTLISVTSNPEIVPNGNLLSTEQSSEESVRKLNDTTVAEMKQIPHVVDATPLASVWVKSIRLKDQDKKYYASIIAYTPGTKVLNVPVSAGRSLQEGDLDKIVVGLELLRRFGYADRPQDIVGQTVILSTQEYVDWGEDPPKPPENADSDYWDALQKQSHNITAEIVGVVTNGPDDNQNYITLAWAKRLLTTKNWEWDEEKRKAWEEERNALEQQLRIELEEQQRTAGPGAQNIDWNAIMMKRLNELGFNNSNGNFQMLVKHDTLLKNGYGSILVRVDATENIETVANTMKSAGFGVQTAQEMLNQIKKIFSLIGMIIGAIGGISLLVAAIGIINTMIMATYERIREIGILRACGATRATIRWLFIFEAALLGFWGGIIGLILSFGLAKIGNAVGNSIALSQNVPIHNLISFPLWLLVGVIALTTTIGALAGLMPAIRASRLDPAEALRYE